jgi:hypothetical protein
MTDPGDEYTLAELRQRVAPAEVLEALGVLHEWGASVFERAVLEHLMRDEKLETEP